MKVLAILDLAKRTHPLSRTYHMDSAFEISIKYEIASSWACVSGVFSPTDRDNAAKYLKRKYNIPDDNIVEVDMLFDDDSSQQLTTEGNIVSF